MEKSEGYLKVGIKINDLELQLSLYDEAVKECDETGREAEKDIEAHFAKCINALAERKAVLLRELAQKVIDRKRMLQDTRVKLETSIIVCKQTLQAGSTSYTVSPTTANVIWKSIKSIPAFRFSSVRMNANLPMTFFQAIQKHGEVGDTSRFSEAAMVTTLAGSKAQKGGKGTEVILHQPWGICLSPHDQCLYISDSSNKSIKKLTMQGQVSTFSAFGYGVDGIVMNHKENCFYVTSFDGHYVMKISSSGIASLFVGSGQPGRTDGVGLSASFNKPLGITINQQTGDLFVTDQGSNLIRKITSQGEVSTLAGSEGGFADGNGSAAKFSGLRGICYDENSQSLLVCDSTNHKLRRVQLNGEVSTLCEVQSPACVAVTKNYTILVSTNGHTLQKVIHQGSQRYKVEALAGSGRAAREDGGPDTCSFNNPRGIVVHEESHTCFVADYYSHAIRKVSFVNPN